VPKQAGQDAAGRSGARACVAGYALAREAQPDAASAALARLQKGAAFGLSRNRLLAAAALQDDYAAKEELFKRREEILRKKDLELQSALVLFDKFLKVRWHLRQQCHCSRLMVSDADLQENEHKRRRAETRARDENVKKSKLVRTTKGARGVRSRCSGRFAAQSEEIEKKKRQLAACTQELRETQRKWTKSEFCPADARRA
jgi:hypothetical protein